MARIRAFGFFGDDAAAPPAPELSPPVSPGPPTVAEAGVMAAAGLVMLLGAGLIGAFVMSQKGTLRANGKRRRRGRKRMRRNGHIRQPGDRGPTTIKASPQRRARAAQLLRMARGHEEAMYASAKNANHLSRMGYIDDAVSAKNDFLRHQKEAGRLRDAALEITSPRLVKLKRNGGSKPVITLLGWTVGEPDRQGSTAKARRFLAAHLGDPRFPVDVADLRPGEGGWSVEVIANAGAYAAGRSEHTKRLYLTPKGRTLADAQRLAERAVRKLYTVKA